MSTQPSSHVKATVERVTQSQASPLDQAEALVELAMDLQRQPRNVQELQDALFLYEAAERRAAGHPLAIARAQAGRGSALRRVPGCGTEELLAARTAFEQALPILRELGEREEVAEVEMSHGLVLQALSAVGKAVLKEAIAAYQRALRTFKQDDYPREYAILHNNLATAYLSVRMADDGEGLREALAVRSFQEALKVITLDEDPSEYAMLQNNLGNALQAVSSKNRMANLLRAVEAYDEALRVRTEYTTPVEYANTIANKANALMNLPDDLARPEQGNPNRLREAAGLLREAGRIFAQHGVHDRAQVVGELAADLERDIPGPAEHLEASQGEP